MHALKLALPWIVLATSACLGDKDEAGEDGRRAGQGNGETTADTGEELGGDGGGGNGGGGNGGGGNGGGRTTNHEPTQLAISISPSLPNTADDHG